MYVDSSFIKKQITRYGEPIDLEVYSTESYSDYGDLIQQTTTLHEVQSVFNTYGQRDSYNQEGSFGEASYSFFFPGEQTGLEINNIIVRADGERWKIEKVVKHSLSGKNVVTECAVSNS